MSDSLGPIPIPDPPFIGAFPLRGDYGGGIDYQPPIVTHVFDQPGLRTEQRYLLGSGMRRFRINRDHLSCTEYDQIKAHWQQAQGQYAEFNYTYYSPGGGTEVVRVRYENPNLSIDQLVGMMATVNGLTFLEVPTTTPAKTSVKHVSRFPDSVLTTALLSQVQQFIPMIKIQARAPSTGAALPAALYISDQRTMIDGQLYLPRLAQWSGIAQTMSETSDSTTFTMGNADDVWTKYGNQINLYRARVNFSLFHLNTNYVLDLWAGYARPWSLTSDGQFVLPVSDGVFELTLNYPTRQISRTCWKIYKGPFCPSVSSLPDCPKDYDACVARGVEKSFGGVIAVPQTVHIKDITTGVLGFGRSTISSVSIADDSIYQRPVQEVYTDKAMKVQCDVAAGRDEKEFYSALGVVSEGPIGLYHQNLIEHTLDDQPPHDPLHGGGWRGIVGNDPAGVADYFNLSSFPWGAVPPGSTYAGGLAFAEIRRTDADGVQLSKVSDRKMIVTVDQGICGWTWNSPGDRVWTRGLANPVWIAINVYLRALGMRLIEANASQISASVMEQFFDCPQAIAMAAICDQIVNNLLVPGQTEKQFPFRGALKERKPLKDWLQEILNTCLGYYTFTNGKLWIGIRYHSGATNAFTVDNILFKSLQATPVTPQFNWLVGQFGDEEFDWALNTVTLYDIDNAQYLGEVNGSTQYLQSNMSFVGISNKSQCARVITTRLREELGGVGLPQQLAARNLRFRTTLLSLASQVGDVISLTHSRLPNGYQENRIVGWTLNPDYSIDITGNCTTDEMYDLTVGPKPADVPADPVIPELLPSVAGLAWMPDHIAPFAGDPLYPDPAERSFDLWQDYNLSRDGVWTAAVYVGGEMVINNFAEQVQPRIVGVQMIPGGSIAGPMTIYASIGQHDEPSVSGNSGYTVPSNLVALYIPEGSTGLALHLDTVPAAGSWDNWDLYVGTDRRRIALQSTTTGALPAAVTFNGPIHPMTRELPEGAARKVRIAAKHVWHAGVVGVLVASVPAINKIQSNDFIGATDNWVGRVLSAVADASDGSAPLWNFTVTAFDAPSGTFTVTPNCVRGTPEDSVQPGDVLVVRSKATSAGVDFVEDTLWNNSVSNLQFDTVGLHVDEEIGRLVRILRGKGAGQLRTVTGNTNIRLQITPDWDTIPDASSVVIVEAREWTRFSETSDVNVPAPGVNFELRLPVDNLQNFVVMVGGFLVDDRGRLSDEEFVVCRDIFVFAEPPGVRDIGPAPGDPDDPDHNPWWTLFTTDQTLRADTTANDIEVHLLPLAGYQGRTLYVVNGSGTHNVIAKPAAGETLWDGEDYITVIPTTTARITAAGD